MRFFAVPILAILLTTALVFSACQLYQPALSDIRTGSQIDDRTKEVTSPQSSFPIAVDAVYASVYLERAGPGTKLRATWQWEGNRLSEPTEIDASGTRFAAFNIQRPRDGWARGDYTVTIEVPGTDQILQANFIIQ